MKTLRIWNGQSSPNGRVIGGFRWNCWRRWELLEKRVKRVSDGSDLWICQIDLVWRPILYHYVCTTGHRTTHSVHGDGRSAVEWWHDSLSVTQSRLPIVRRAMPESLKYISIVIGAYSRSLKAAWTSYPAWWWREEIHQPVWGKSTT